MSPLNPAATGLMSKGVSMLVRGFLVVCVVLGLSLPANSQTDPVSSGPIFIGNSPPVIGSGAVLFMSSDITQDRVFSWSSSDSILGSLDTGLVTASSWIVTGTSPVRLIFTGGGSGASFSGNVIFEPYNRAVVDVVKGSQRVRYVLKVEPVKMIMVNISDKEISFAPEASEADQAPFNPAPGQPGGNGGFGGPPPDTTMATLSNPFKLHSVVFNFTTTPRTINITLKSNVSAFEQSFVLQEDSDGSNYFTDSTGSQGITILKPPTGNNSQIEMPEVFFTSTTFGWFGALTLAETGVSTNLFESERITMVVKMPSAPTETVIDTMDITLDSDLAAKMGIGPITQTLTESGPATNIYEGPGTQLEATFLPPELGGRLSLIATVDNNALSLTRREADAAEDLGLPPLTLTTDSLHNQGEPTFVAGDLRSFAWTPVIRKSPIAQTFNTPKRAILLYKRGGGAWTKVGDAVDGSKLDFLRLFNDVGQVKMSIASNSKTRYWFYVIEDNDPVFATPRWHKVAKPSGILSHPDWWYEGICKSNQSLILAGTKNGDMLRLVWDRNEDGLYQENDELVHAELKIIVLDLDVDTDMNGTIDDQDDKKETDPKAIIINVNNDSDAGLGNIDNQNNTIDGAADKSELTPLLIRNAIIPEGWKLLLKVSDKTKLRIFDDADTGVIGPPAADGGPDKDTHEIPKAKITAGDLKYLIEAFNHGNVTISLILQDASGKEVGRDEVKVVLNVDKLPGNDFNANVAVRFRINGSKNTNNIEGMEAKIATPKAKVNYAPTIRMFASTNVWISTQSFGPLRWMQTGLAVDRRVGQNPVQVIYFETMGDGVNGHYLVYKPIAGPPFDPWPASATFKVEITDATTGTVTGFFNGTAWVTNKNDWFKTNKFTNYQIGTELFHSVDQHPGTTSDKCKVSDAKVKVGGVWQNTAFAAGDVKISDYDKNGTVINPANSHEWAYSNVTATGWEMWDKVVEDP